MPTRILRDGIIDSRAVNALSEPGEILYRRLMSIVDDYGRFEADPELIRARCFPRQLDRWTIQRITDILPELTVIHGDLRLVTVYAVESKKYLQINNFGQRVQCKEKYPSPDSRESTVIHGDSPSSRSRSRSRSRSSVVEGALVNAPEKSGASKKHRISETTLPQEWHQWAFDKYNWDWARSTRTFEKFLNYWQSKGELRADWKASWRTWVINDEERNPSKPVHVPLPPPKFWVDDLLDPK